MNAQATAAKKNVLHYLNQAFQPGMVFDTLQASKFDIVIGLDIGHGESMAYVYHKDSTGEWVSEQLVVSTSGDKYTPSYIAYGGGKPSIGSDAVGQANSLTTYFKKDPSRWDDPSEDKVHTYGELMRDYITALWKIILSKNDVVKDCEKEQVLITVGCPASGSWTKPEYMKRYAALVQEATGYPNVTILPESTAAIMTPVYAKTPVDLQGGVAVYDLGSSTTDFTFILMGKVLIFSSLCLGGSDIDRAMLRKVAKENGYNLGDSAAWSLASAHTKMRVVKERFYNTGEADQSEDDVKIHRDLDFYMDETFLRAALQRAAAAASPADLDKALSEVSEDAMNDAMLAQILDSHDMEQTHIPPKARKNIYSQLSEARARFQASKVPFSATILYKSALDYALDKDMMDSVLRKDTQVTSQLAAPYAGLSWCSAIEKFFERTRDAVRNKGYDCETVILTGGTCKVTAVQEIAEACYPGKVHREDNPSASVAKGLCLAKGHEVGAAEQLEAAKKGLKQALTPQFHAFCQGYAKNKLFDEVWNQLALVAKGLDDGANHTYAELKKRVNSATVGNPAFIDQLKTDLSDYILDFMDPAKWDITDKKDCCTVIQEKANALAAKVYHVEAASLPEIPSDMLSSVVQVMDPAVVDRVVNGMNLPFKLQRLAVDFLWSGSNSLWGRAARLLGYMNALLADLLDAGDCLLMAEAMADATIKEQNRGKLSERFSRELKDSQSFREAFDTLMETQLETAIGIVLFLIFEDYEAFPG